VCGGNKANAESFEVLDLSSYFKHEKDWHIQYTVVSIDMSLYTCFKALVHMSMLSSVAAQDSELEPGVVMRCSSFFDRSDGPGSKSDIKHRLIFKNVTNCNNFLCYSHFAVQHWLKHSAAMKFKLGQLKTRQITSVSLFQLFFLRLFACAAQGPQQELPEQFFDTAPVSSLAEPHHFYAAPAAPAPDPILMCSKVKF
jgi:hypothetical protein